MKVLTNRTISAFISNLTNKGLSPKDALFRINSAVSFISWLSESQRISESDAIRFRNELYTAKHIYTKPRAPMASLPLKYVGFSLGLLSLLIIGAGIYLRFYRNVQTPFAFSSAPLRAGRTINFQGRLTDTLGNPITAPIDVTYNFYTTTSGGVALTGATRVCTASPDQDGVFNTLIGNDVGGSSGGGTLCNVEIPASVFTENANVYLGVKIGTDPTEMTPRQQIANVGYAINSETLQGLPPGSNVSNIPFINAAGDMLIAAANPGLRSISSSSFTISSAQATTIQSAGGGDITLSATDGGSLRFKTYGGSILERMTILNTGNVGIGTTLPTAMLDIAGDASLSGNLVLRGTSSNYLRMLNGASFRISTSVGGDAGNTDVFTVLNNGSVGIGTTTPTAKLDLIGNFRVSSYATISASLALGTSNADAGPGNITMSGNLSYLGTLKPGGSIGTSGYVLTTNGVTNSWADPLVLVGGTNYWQEVSGTVAPKNITDALNLGGIATTSALVHFPGTNNQNAWFTLGTGNLGVGNTSPNAKLDVAGTASISGTLTLGNGTTNALQSPYGPLTLNYKSGLNAWLPGLTLQDGTGNVGIGTTKPINLFTLQSNTQYQGLTLRNNTYDIIRMFGSDTNNESGTIQLFSGNVSKVQLWSNGVSYFNGGNVGIGTTTPAAMLDIVGNLNVSSYATVGASLAVGYNNAPAGSGNAIFSGNVGIGTASATYKMDISSTTNGSDTLRVINTSSGILGKATYDAANNVGDTFSIGISGGGYAPWGALGARETFLYTPQNITLMSSAVSGATGGIIKFATGGNSEKMRIDSSGNVGIGTTNPGEKLEVNGAVHLTSTTPNSTGNALYATGTTLYWNGSALATGGSVSGTTNYISKFTSSSSLGISGIYETGGSVGIGTTAPLAKLQVGTTPVDTGSFTVTGPAFFKSLTNNGGSSPSVLEPALILGREGISGQAYANYAQFNIGRYVNSGINSKTQLDLRLMDTSEANGTTIMSFQSGGNVGVGTTTPNAKLDIAGTASISGTLTLGNGTTNALQSPYGPLTLNYKSGLNAWSTGITLQDGTGNVGIGNVSPVPMSGYKLSVAGNGNFSSSDTDGLISFGNYTGNYIKGSSSALQFLGWDSNISAYRTNITMLDIGGNVGIGTTAPTATLEIAGNLKVSSYATISASLALGTSNADAGPGNITMSGSLSYLGTLKPGGSIGTSGYVLTTNGVTNSWADPLVLVGGTNYWQEVSGTVAPKNITDALNLGGIATTSALVHFPGTNNQNAWFTLGTGNVGVGNTSPNAKLDVTGTASISGTLTLGNGTTNALQSPYGPLTLNYKSGLNAWSTGITLQDGTGNVGIGTTNPTALLQVNGDVRINGTNFLRLNTNGNLSYVSGSIDGFSSNIQLADSSAENIVLTAKSTGILNFRTNNTSRMIVDSSGNIGVGTTTPNATFDLAGTASISGTLTLGNGTTNTLQSPYGPLTLNYKSGLNAWLPGLTLQDGTGNVGIGTTNPGYKLAVGGGGISLDDNQYLSGNGHYLITSSTGNTYVGMDGNTYIRGGGSNRIFIKGAGGLIGIGTVVPLAQLHVVGTNAGNAAEIVDQLNSGDIFTASASGTTKFVIANNGNVGIGTSSPGYTLDIQGWASASGNLTAGGQLQIGRFASAPTALGLGANYYNAATNKQYYWNGSTWVDMTGGSGSQLWQETSGSLAALNITDDINVGAVATGSALVHLPGTNNQNAWFNIGTGALGIGTTSPNYLSATSSGVLSLEGGTGTGAASTGPTLELSRSSDTYAPGGAEFGVIRFFAGSAHTQLAAIRSVLDGTTPSGGSRLDFWTTPAGSTIKKRMTIDQNGNVGIGIAAPNAKLDVSGAIMGGNQNLDPGGSFSLVPLQGTGKTLLGMNYSAGQVEADFIQNSNGYPGGFRFYNYTNSGVLTNLLTIAGSGAVGIGTTTPAQALDVVGNIQASKFIDADGPTYFLDPANSGGTSVYLAGDALINGNMVVGIGGGGKITTGTVDPPYTINGQKYATYLPSMTGVKEETTGKVLLSNKDESTKTYYQSIDLTNQPEGSDLWLFAKATDMKDQSNQLTVLLSATTNAKIWYQIDTNNARLTLFSNSPTELSYRLTAPRFDASKWANTRNASDTSVGLVINDQGNVVYSPTAPMLNKPQLASLSPQDIAFDGNLDTFRQNNARFSAVGSFVEELAAASEAVIGRLKTGFIETENMLVNNILVVNHKIVSPVVETENITATGVAQLNTIATNEIKPAANDVTVNLSSPSTPATDKGSLAALVIKGLNNAPVVRIDAEGNASFSGNLASASLTTQNATVSGTLIAKTIQSDNINAIESNVASMSSTLASNTSQFTSDINSVQQQLAAIKNQPLPNPAYYQNMDASYNNLTVSGTTNLYKAYVTDSLVVGTLFIQPSSILALSDDLRISSLSTIRLFDDTVIIAKNGNITSKGEISASSLAIRNTNGDTVASIDASGSARFSEVIAKKFTLENIATQGAFIADSGIKDENNLPIPAIKTSAEVAGIGTLPQDTKEVIVYNDNITDNSLVYLTPTTDNMQGQLTVAKKVSCPANSTNLTNSTNSTCSPYFIVSSSAVIHSPSSFNWLIINGQN